MNMLTRTEMAQHGDGKPFERPDPKSVLVGLTQMKFHTNGISLVPQITDDVRRLEAVFPRDNLGEELFRGRWIDPIHFEISGTAIVEQKVGEKTIRVDRPIKFYFRTQSPRDQAKIEQTCPRDQTCAYRIGWRGELMELRNVDDLDARPSAEQKEFARVNALYDPDLETEAAKMGVIWDTEASRKTMVERVTAAAMAKMEESQQAEMTAFAEKEQTASVEKIKADRGKRKPEPAGV